MNTLTRLVLVTLVGIALVCAALYTALPSRITAVQAIRNNGAEVVLKIVGDSGGDATRTFMLPPPPRNTPRLGIAVRPATYLERPSGTITIVVGTRDRCTFGPGQYTDGGAITCPVTQPGAVKLRVSVRGATGPLALIERQSSSGKAVAGLWVQVPANSLEGRTRFVLTALSTTRPWPFSWPLAIFSFTIAVCASLWLGLFVMTRADEPEVDATAGVEPPPA